MILNVKSLSRICFALMFAMLSLSVSSQSKAGKSYTPFAKSGDFILYEKEVYPNPKSFVSVTKYYFSYKTSDEAYELTKFNLKKVFIKNPDFCDAIEQYFNSDAELPKYDLNFKQYTLIRLYNKYINK